MVVRRTSRGPAPGRPVGREQVAKPGGGTRSLVRLDPVDALAFDRSVARVMHRLSASRGPESHANRPLGWDPRRGLVLEPWKRARQRWRGEVRRLGSDARSIAVTDVRDCYGSIAASVVQRRLLALGVPPGQVHEIASWLDAFGDAGIRGLPVGPTASALLADAVLTAGDEALRPTGARFVRWVDDVAIFALDARTRAAALGRLRDTWASVGLESHDAKTALLDDLEGTTGSPVFASIAPATSSALR